MWKLLKYISLFCWCRQSRRTMTRHLNQPSYDFSLCPKDRKNNTTQHDTINWMGIKSGKGVLINFLKLFYGIDAQHDNWWWRFFFVSVRHIPPNRSTFSYPKADGNFYFGIIIQGIFIIAESGLNGKIELYEGKSSSSVQNVKCEHKFGVKFVCHLSYKFYRWMDDSSERKPSALKQNKPILFLLQSADDLGNSNRQLEYFDETFISIPR